MDYEVVYSGAMERAAIQAQQIRVAAEGPPVNTSALLRDYMAAHPQWWTITDLATVLGVDRRVVASRLNGMVHRGEAKRLYPPFKVSSLRGGEQQKYRLATKRRKEHTA